MMVIGRKPSGFQASDFRTLPAISNKELLNRSLTQNRDIDDDMFVMSKTCYFVEREWLIDDIEDKLSANQMGKFIWINGASGVGKSTFVANLYNRLNHNTGGVYFCKYDEEKIRYASPVIKGLAYIINNTIDDYADMV